MPIGSGIVYNTGDLILSQVSSSGTAFLETKIAAATSSLIYFDSTARINSASLNSITVGTSSYVSGSTSIITNLTASNISASGTGYFNNLGVGTTVITEKINVAGNILLSNGSNRFVRIGSSTNYNYDLQTTGNDFQIIEAGTTPRLTIQYPNGNIGIGTTNPAYLLDVSGSSRHGYRAADTHQFTGSVSFTDGLFLTNLTASNISASSRIIATSFTGSLLGTSSWASNALTASFLPVGTYNITSSWAQNVVSASFATTAQTANALNTANSYTITNLTASGVVRAAQIAEKVVTFTPLTGSITGAPAWYRIISGSGVLDSGRVRMSANYDNSRSDIEFTYAVRNYDTDGAGAFINITRASTYNTLFNAVRVIETGNLAEPYAIDVLIGNYLNNTTPGTVTCLYESQFIGAVLDTPTFVSASATGSNIVKTVYTTYTSGYPRIGPTYSDGLAVANYQGQLTVGYRGNYAYNTPSTLNYALLVSGSVGIGTSSPADKLSVISGSTRIASTALAGALYFGNDTSNIYLQRDNNYDLSLVQNGDSNSALYLASAGSVYVNIDSNNNDTDKAFIVQNNALKAGTELFRIQENGNVGVGTTSPAAKLHIYNGSSHFEATSNGNATIVAGLYALQIGPLHDRDSTAGRYYGGIAFNHLLNFGGATTYNGAPQAWIGTRLQDTTGSERDYLVFATKPGTGVSGTGNDIPIERMCIDRDGLVGIGTTVPGALLDVSYGDYQNAGTIRIGADLGTNTSRTNNTRKYGAITLFPYNNASASVQAIGIDAQGPAVTGLTIGGGGTGFASPTQIQFYTTSSTIVPGAERMRIDSSGNVGIGTTSPSYLLDVYKTSNDSVIRSRTIGAGAYLYLDSATDGWYGINLLSGSTSRWFMGGYGTTSFTITRGIGATEYFRIDTAGNVGIGTTNPSSRLHISGSSSTAITITDDALYTNSITNDNSVMTYTVDTGNAAASSAAHIFKRFNTELVRITHEGRVGVGTSIPATGFLDVRSNQSKSLAGPTNIAFFGSNDAANPLGLAVNHESSSGVKMVGLVGTEYGSSGNNIKINETIHVQYTGNVGIRTINPVATLQVAGNVSGSSFTSSISNAVGFLGTSSWASNVVSASYAITSSVATNETLGTVTGRGASTGTQITVATATAGSMFTGRKAGSSYGDTVSGATFKSITDNSQSFATSYAFAAYYSGSSGINSFYVSSNGDGYFSGSVGIGTTVPSARLHVTGSTGGIFEVDTAGGATSLYVSASGNVGIGTANATDKLTLYGALASYKTGADTIQTQVYLANTPNTRAFNVQLNSGGTGLDLWSYNSSNAWLRHTTFDYNGSVGIGTATSILGKLQLDSGVAPYYGPATGSATPNGMFTLGSVTGDVVNTFGVDASATAYAWIQPRKVTGATYYSLALNPNGGNVGIGTVTPAAKLEITGSSNSALLNIKSPISGAILYVSGSGAVGIGTSNVGAFTLQVNGSFGATTKSFIIDHPTKAGKKLMYGSLESPYHGIRLTGRDTLVNGKCKVELPDYIYKLILHDSVNIQLTGIKCNKTLYVDDINIPENYFTIAYDKAIFESYKDYDFFWDFTAIRADVPELTTEL